MLKNFGVAIMGKMKCVKVSRKSIERMLFACKIMSESLEDDNVIIRQFNNLNPNQRTEIPKKHLKNEEKLKAYIENADEDIYLTCTMVNLNILASEFDIDPATVCLCIRPLCKGNQKILVVK